VGKEERKVGEVRGEEARDTDISFDKNSIMQGKRNLEQTFKGTTLQVTP
jgi:hypothetical protein